MSEAAYVERFARQTIKVDGTIVDVFVMGDGSELPISADLSEDMDRVAAQLAYWGAIAAEAKGELTKVDAWYRRFCAQFAAEKLASDPKMSEWKVKAAVEASDGFVQHKQAIAMAEKNLMIAEAMMKAFEKKANQLQSRGAKTRAELSAQGMTTPAEPRGPRGWNLSGRGSDKDDDGYVSEARRQPSREEKIRRMEEINSAKARGKKKKRGK